MRQEGGLRLGSVAGVEVRIDWSLLIIFTLILLSLGSGPFRTWHPDWSAGLIWSTALAAALLFFASVLAHEMSHALVGRAYGIRIRRITLFLFGGIAQMENEPPSWRAELVMALAGPLMSLLLGLAFIWLAAAVAGPITVDPGDPRAAFAALGPVPSLLLWLGPVNIVLALFNLVPGFPLDGGRVLRAAIWGATGDYHLATRWASSAGRVFGWLLMGIGVAMILGMRVPFFGSGGLSGLWLVLIGWFLSSMALMSYRQMLISDSIKGMSVDQLMQTRFTRVDPRMSIATLVDEQLMASGQSAFPIEDNGRFLGMVSLADLRKRERASWPNTSLGEIMTPASALVTATPEQDAGEALALLAQRGLNQLPVVRDGALLGLLRREDVLRWLSLATGAVDTA